MDTDQKYLADLAEMLSLSDEVKKDPRFEEAKVIATRLAPFKDGAIKKSAELKKELNLKSELNRLVPGFSRYLLIGQASIATIRANQSQISLATVYLPSYRGEFFFCDQDSVSKRTYLMKDFNERQLLSFAPPLGGVTLQEPWLIATPYDDPILTLEQARLVIQHNRRT